MSTIATDTNAPSPGPTPALTPSPAATPLSPTPSPAATPLSPTPAPSASLPPSLTCPWHKVQSPDSISGCAITTPTCPTSTCPCRADEFLPCIKYQCATLGYIYGPGINKTEPPADCKLGNYESCTCANFGLSNNKAFQVPTTGNRCGTSWGTANANLLASVCSNNGDCSVGDTCFSAGTGWTNI